MKKRYLFRFAALLSLMAIVQSGYSQESKVEPFVEFSPVLTFGDKTQGSFILNGGATWKVVDRLSLGFGAGVHSSFKFNQKPSIPVFFRSRFDLSANNASIIPFLMFDAGYNFSLEDFDYSSVIISPTIGIRTHGFYFGVGYLASIATKGGGVGHNLAFRLGYQFKSTSKVNTTFFKNSNFKVEAGYAYGLTKKNYVSHNSTYQKRSSAPFVRTIWMFRPSEKFNVGIGTGVDVFLSSIESSFKEHDAESYTETSVSIPIFVRPQYNFLPADAKFVPYLACDLGYRISTYTDATSRKFKGLVFEPQVGVNYKKWNAALGYHLVHESDFYGDVNNSNLSLRVGYTF